MTTVGLPKSQILCRQPVESIKDRFPNRITRRILDTSNIIYPQLNQSLNPGDSYILYNFNALLPCPFDFCAFKLSNWSQASIHLYDAADVSSGQAPINSGHHTALTPFENPPMDIQRLLTSLSLKIIIQFAIMIVAMVVLVIWNLDFIDQFYLQNQQTQTGILINSTIAGLLTFGLFNILYHIIHHFSVFKINFIMLVKLKVI